MGRTTDDDASADTMAADHSAGDTGIADTMASQGHGAPPSSGSLGTPPSDGPSAIAAAGARYTLGRLLGKGGMGEVRLARDPRVDRDVAVKMMRDPGSADAVARFLREARVQGRLEHPCVVPVHDLGVDDRGAPYFAMKRLAGTTLADAIAAVAAGGAEARARWPRRLLLDRLADVCLAVEFAHARGVVHRDLKPSNIMLGDYGEAYVLDWGIARVGSEGGSITGADLGSIDVPHDGAQTAAGALLGTPGYMAPEQMRGEAVDRRADVYALGCVLFEILTLAPALPRGHAAFEATLSATPFRPRERVPEADVPPELDDACARATAPDVAQRTPTARELAAQIRAYLDGDRDSARRRELANDHARRAARALASGDAGRPEAMREAGRAIALDAECAAAQAVLARALFTRPEVPPPAVVDAVRGERANVGRIQLRAAAVLYLGFMLLMPSLLAFGVDLSWPFAATFALVTANFAIIYWGSRLQRIPPGAVEIVIVLHAVQLATTGILFGPLIAVPAFAIGSVAACLWYPSERRPALIVALHLVALAVPFVLEWTGALPRTFWIAGDAIVLRPWATGIDGTMLAVLAVLAVVIQMLALAGLIVHQRGTQESAQEQIHLTKWHLDQLVPAEART